MMEQPRPEGLFDTPLSPVEMTIQGIRDGIDQAAQASGAELDEVLLALSVILSQTAVACGIPKDSLLGNLDKIYDSAERGISHIYSKENVQ